MTVTIDALEASEESAARLHLPGRLANNRVRRRSLGALVVSTAWQSRFVLTMEFIGFATALVIVNAALGELPFTAAFLAAYALATGATFRWRSRLNLSVLDDLPLLVMSLAAAAGIAYWVAAGVGYWAASAEWSPPRPYEVAVAAAVGLLVIIASKMVSYVAVKAVRSSAAHEGEHAVVLGVGRDADFLIDRIGTHREYGLKLIGHIDPQALDGAEGRTRRDLLDQAFSQYSTVRTLLVTDLGAPDLELMPVLRAAVSRGCNVYYVPRFAELNQFRLNAEAIWGLPLHAVSAPGGALQRVLKRSLDVVVAGTASLLLAPLMLVVGLIIRRETGGAILFRQCRVGRGGREFDLLKFQTLVPRDLAEGDTGWNISNDDRLGPVGRFLRSTSLDELPQLWNVLRGDMSLVGPRPERPHYVSVFSERYSHYADRHRVPVGLTGWAQIHRLRGDTSIDDRARFDNAYCDQWSVWSDAKIMLKTVPELFRHSGG